MADPRRTILIVDDSRLARALTRVALEVDRHRVLEVADARAALGVVEAEPVDLVMIDVNMPDVDGLELVRLLRAAPCPRIPILMLSTEAGEDLKRRGRDVGATGWIVKPFEPARLRATVQHVLERSAT